MFRYLPLLALIALACSQQPVGPVDTAAVADTAATDAVTAEILSDVEVDGTDALPDATVDIALDVISEIDVPAEITAACGWPVMTCPGVCPAPYPCGPCDNGNACGWVAMPPMSTPRESFNAAWGDDGLYVWGGISDTWAGIGGGPPGTPWWNGVLASGEKWDPKTNTWTLLPQAPLLPATNAAVVWGGDRLYVLAHEYNYPADHAVPWTSSPANGAMWLPKQGVWKPLPTLNAPDPIPGAVAWTGSKLIDAVPPGGGPGAEYDPQTDAWTPLPSLGPGKHIYHSDYCSGWTGDRLMIFDLDGPQGVTWLPAAATWETFDPASGEAFPFRLWSRCVGISGGLAVFGAPKTEQSAAAAKLWLRWQAATQWEAIALPPWLPARDSAALAWTGKQIALWGGTIPSPSGAIELSDGALYDPIAKTWTRIPSIGVPAPRPRDAATATNGGVLYLIGGGDGPAMVNETFADGGRLLLPP